MFKVSAKLKKVLPLIAVLFFSPKLFSCECEAFDIDKVVANSTYIITGQLIDAKYLQAENLTLANFYVHQSHKGEVYATEDAIVETFSQQNPCGLQLTMENIYALFIDENDFVTSCSSFNLSELDRHYERRKQFYKYFKAGLRPER
jgi:hypothetical protein